MIHALFGLTMLANRLLAKAHQGRKTKAFWRLPLLAGYR